MRVESRSECQLKTTKLEQQKGIRDARSQHPRKDPVDDVPGCAAPLFLHHEMPNDAYLDGSNDLISTDSRIE